MGFPVGYTEVFVFPNLFLHTLSLLGFIRNLIFSLFHFLGLSEFLETDDIVWPESESHLPETHPRRRPDQGISPRHKFPRRRRGPCGELRHIPVRVRGGGRDQVCDELQAHFSPDVYEFNCYLFLNVSSTSQLQLKRPIIQFKSSRVIVCKGVLEQQYQLYLDFWKDVQGARVPTIMVSPWIEKGTDCMNVLETWEGVRGWVIPERKRVEFWVWRKNECYKLEIAFENFMDSVGCCLDGEKVNASMLMLCRLF